MKKEYDYSNKCGSCKYFVFYTRNGEVLRHGVCEKKTSIIVNNTFYPHHHVEAHKRACKKYEEDIL
jgi:hypothetical protein